MKADAAERISPNVITLPNGLTVVTEERHNAPVVSFWVGYRVGSRNELPGYTGVAHWIEHMLFKPTEAFPGAERDRLISRDGGYTNAFTWVDGTAYYTTMPADKADLAYRVEADRMINSVFDPEIFETERTVILAERGAYENQPDWRLTEQVTATAFQAHAYRHEVIGLAEDIKRLARDDLHRFFQTYYTPNNAVVVAVGSFRQDEVVKRVEEMFGSIPPGPEPPPVIAREPEPTGERRVTVEGPGATGYLEISYRAPAVTDPDYPAALVLGTLLGGAISIGFGGGGENRSSRLYRALVDTGIAVDVDCNLDGTIDPYLFDISAMLRTERTHQDAEDAVDRVVQEIAEKPVTDAELAKGRKQVIAQFVYGNERISNRGMMLMLAHSIFTLDLMESFVERIGDVTAADVQRVAAKLLRKQNRVVGRYVATDDGEGDE